MGDILMILFLMIVVWCFGYSLSVSKGGKRIRIPAALYRIMRPPIFPDDETSSVMGFIFFGGVTIPSLLAYLVCIALLIMKTDIYMTVLRCAFTIDVASFLLFMLIQAVTDISGS